MTTTASAPPKRHRQLTFREHVRRQAAKDFVIARKILEDPADCVASIKKAGKWRDDMMLTLEPAQASLGFS